MTNLLHVIKYDSLVSGIKKSPTKLTSYASDCFIFILHHVIEDETLIFENLKNVYDFIQEIASWNEEHHICYHVALQIISKNFADVLQICHRFHENDLGEETKSQFIEIAKGILKTYLKFMLENEKYHFIKKSEISHFFSGLLHQITMLSAPDQEITDESTLKLEYSLICVSMMINRMIKEYSAQDLTSAVSLAISSSNSNISRLSIYLLKLALKTSLGDDLEKVYQHLLTLMDQQDNATKAIIILISDVVLKHPSKLLKPIFMRINSKNGKANALEILLEMFRQQMTVETRLEITNLIGHQLLDRLGDDDIELRKKTEQIFGNFDVEYLLPKLFRLLHHKNIKIRASATSSVQNLLKRHATQESVVPVFINTLTTPLYESPSDIDEFDDSIVQQDVEIIKYWIEATSPEVYLQSLIKIINQSLNNPNDAIFIQVITKFVYDEKFNNQACLNVTKLILEYIQDKMDPKNVFSQLIPLLIVKTMPTKFFEQNFDQVVILYQFAYKCIISHPLDEIKRVCAEIVGKFTCKEIFSDLMKNLKDFVQIGDWENVKALIYCMCSLALNQKTDGTKSEEISKNCFYLLKLDPKNEAIYKCQHGSIELLSILLKKNEFGEILDKIVDRIKNGDNVDKICMINTLTSCVKYTSVVEMNKLAEKTINLLFSLASTGMVQVRVAASQSILHYSNKLRDGVFPYITALFQLVNLSLKDKSPELRLSGLKVLSAVLVSRDDVIKGNEKVFEEIQKQISSMINLETDREVQGLAMKLRGILVQENV